MNRGDACTHHGSCQYHYSAFSGRPRRRKRTEWLAIQREGAKVSKNESPETSFKALKQEEAYTMARTHLSSHRVADVSEQHVVLQTQQQLRNSQLLLCAPCLGIPA